MNGWLRAAVLIPVLLAGCAEERPQIPPDRAISLLATGAPMLRCRQECLEAWRKAQPHAAALEAGAQWHDLAILVATVNYQDDLSLYYLGRAAQGLRFPLAAESYYRQSAELSGTTISCENLSGLCGGVQLPRAALSRLASLSARPPARHSRSTGHREPPEPPPPILQASPTPAPLPVAPPLPPAPAPVRQPSRPDADEFIEPPAASR